MADYSGSMRPYRKDGSVQALSVHQGRTDRPVAGLGHMGRPATTG
ncbi:hypothetical protein ACFY8N_31720 [Streptomyces collinus]